MSIGEVVYIIVAFLFAFMTFLIIRGNFQRKFDENGHRHDLKEKKVKEDK